MVYQVSGLPTALHRSGNPTRLQPVGGRTGEGHGDLQLPDTERSDLGGEPWKQEICLSS